MADPDQDEEQLCGRVDAGSARPRVRRSDRVLAALAAGILAGAPAMSASGQPAAAPAPEGAASTTVAPPPALSGPLSGRVYIHGFVSEGGFASTANDYFGSSARAGVEMFEAGINFSAEVADRLRTGLQLFARDVGALRDASPRVDWAFLDYRWRSWFGLRAGIIKMPFGLYNEYVDIDAARLPILLPGGVYPIRGRDVLLSHTGFSIYGNRPLGGAGELEYQAWLGTLTVPRNAIDVIGATLDEVDTRYVAGGQVFWRPPLDGLRLGGTILRASIDFRLTLAPTTTAALIMAGRLPAGFDGRVVVSQRPDTLIVGSAEYVRGDWLFAGEYSRWLKRQRTTIPALIPTFEEDGERFYVMATHRVAEPVELGAYYSIYNVDANDRGGRDPKFAERFYAFQRDLSATLRLDINDHWLWKLEAHFVDGTAGLPPTSNLHPDRYWGLFLLRTTVTF